MDDYIKTAVFKEERCKGNNRNTDITVHVLKKDSEASKFIQDRLTTINTSKDANFRIVNSASLQNQRDGYFLFTCKRSGACMPRSYRAKGCKAYVSFKRRTDWVNKLVIVERIYSIHSGHDPTSSSEVHSEKICEELVKHIQDLLSLGVKPDTILLKSHEWSKEQGHTDLNNRAYFVTPKDIDNIRTCMMRKNQQHKDDANSTTQLLEGPFRECVVFYQPYSPQTDLVIVLQTPSMRDNLREYGKDIVFMDATHCVNQYGFPLFTLIVRDSHGHGIPVAYMILGNEKQATIQLALEKLKPTFYIAPRCFMVDKDQGEINAIRKVFKESDVLLCWYHVTQAVIRWLSRSESGVSGPEKADTRGQIMQLMAELKSCSTNHWEPIGHLWSDFGRCYKHGNSDTNNLIERFFHRLKYQFLCGIRNRRLDHLIDVLLNKTEKYFNIIQDLQSVGRVYNPLQCKIEEMKNSAQRMLDNGWARKVSVASRETYIYNVPSENNPHLVYCVCPAEQFCSCIAGTRGCTCKHLILLSLLTCGDSETFPDINTQLQAHANNLIQRNKYRILCKASKELEVESLFGRAASKPCVGTNVCECCTFSYHKKCACLLLAKGLLNEVCETKSENIENIPVEPIQHVTEDKDRHSLTIWKLENILNTLQTWKKIPEDIAHKVNELDVQIQKVNVNTQRFEKLCDDNSRKIRPLFTNRKRKTNRDIATETMNNITSFPVQPRRKQRAVIGPKKNTKIKV
ncbi:uncharacterized protein [Paramisgurnus dabryanus]|uniref:uncharacterized protein isoform X2 n=1 Tax=Paramisgurnus dabryanus TaxID=90735 RepID=UPI0031F348F4